MLSVARKVLKKTFNSHAWPKEGILNLTIILQSVS